MQAERKLFGFDPYKIFFKKGRENGIRGRAATSGGGAPCALNKQRWEAVFRRERKPVSFDRLFCAEVFCKLREEMRAVCRFSILF